MKKNIKIKSPWGVSEKEVDFMNSEEFNEIKYNEYTPEFVLVDGSKLMYNDYTCHGGFSGTCFCNSHERKSWIDFTFRMVK